MTEISIRKAAVADAQAVFDIRLAAINSQCKGHYRTKDLEIWTAGVMSSDFAKMVEDKCHVATINDIVVGTGMIDLQSGRIDAVFVRPTFMRQGIGRRMMRHLERLAADAGISQLNLEATLNAASFYRAVGFHGDAVSKYYTSHGLALDCIPMIKDLRTSQ